MIRNLLTITYMYKSGYLSLTQAHTKALLGVGGGGYACFHLEFQTLARPHVGTV